jgi:hypothetical protein
MSLQNKVFYNKSSAEKLGWLPSWFSEDDFDGDLVDKIKEFQTKHNVTADGLCGPLTYRLIATEREAQTEMAKDQLKKFCDDEHNYIICEGRRVKIDWGKVVNIRQPEALASSPNCYRVQRRGVEKPSMIVTHFDVCLSAKSCHRVLERRGISSHFAIDNDGTIYQMLDTVHEGWHAGNRKVNAASIGIDISNAIYLKYQKYYRVKGFGNRPVLTDLRVHNGVIKECLGFYPVQVEAYKALVKTLCKHYDIPIDCPRDDDGGMLMKVHPPSVKAKYCGVVNHFHLTRNKWDTANLDLAKALEEINNEAD